MEKADIFLFEPSEFMRLFIRRALEQTPYTIQNEAGNANEAMALLDLDRRRQKLIDLVLISDSLPPEGGAKGTRHVLEHLKRSESGAKVVGIYTVKKFRMQRLKVTTDISHDEVVSNPANLRNLIAEI